MSYYPMWQWPWRACLLAGSIVKSLWADWICRRTCRTCRYCKEPWPGGHYCVRDLGDGDPDGHREPTRLDATCPDWQSQLEPTVHEGDRHD